MASKHSYEVERSICIQADPNTVFDTVNDLRAWRGRGGEV